MMINFGLKTSTLVVRQGLMGGGRFILPATQLCKYTTTSTSPTNNNEVKTTVVPNQTTTTTTTITPTNSNTTIVGDGQLQSRWFMGAAYHKKQSAEYHRNSTLYAYTDRQALIKMEKEFVMPERYHPNNMSDYFAKFSVFALRKISNLFFKEKYISYACVLETVAACPGMVAGMLIHLKTLRSFEHNNWIKVLLDEAENERMHLMTFMELSMPTTWERMAVAGVQGIYWNLFLIFYLLSPKTAHRFTGYLEEEAVISYNNMLRDLDKGLVKNVPAPSIAIDYWGLPDDATLRDVILVIRQDEVDHGKVNHEISNKIRENKHDPIVLHTETSIPKISTTTNATNNNTTNATATPTAA